MRCSTISVISASAMIAAFAVVSAGPALAASTSVSVVCNFGGVTAFIPSTGISGAVASDTVVITGGGGLTNASVTLSGVTGLSSWSSSGSTSDRTYTITSSAPAYIILTGTSGSCNGVSATLSINGGDPSSATSSDLSQIPAPLLQQFGKPVAGTCDLAAPQSLNWSGVASGGWSDTWGEWMNDGKGGAVCSRTLIYSANQAKWIVG